MFAIVYYLLFMFRSKNPDSKSGLRQLATILVPVIGATVLFGRLPGRESLLEELRNNNSARSSYQSVDEVHRLGIAIDPRNILVEENATFVRWSAPTLGSIPRETPITRVSCVGNDLAVAPLSGSRVGQPANVYTPKYVEKTLGKQICDNWRFAPDALTREGADTLLVDITKLGIVDDVKNALDAAPNS